jgi:hypothetical protein
MNEHVPYIWRSNYRNQAASPEKVLEIAHAQAREYLSRAVAKTCRPVRRHSQRARSG